MMYRKFFLIYAWGSSLAWFALISLFSSISNLDTHGEYLGWLLGNLGYEIAFAIQFLLIFRALLITFRFRVDRLRFWKSKREQAEDAEFAGLVEKLLLACAILICVILAIIDEYHQSFVIGRIANIGDILVNLVGIIIAAILSHLAPVVTEIEARLAKLDRK